MPAVTASDLGILSDDLAARKYALEPRLPYVPVEREAYERKRLKTPLPRVL